MSEQSERREYPRAKVTWPVTLITSEAQIEGVIGKCYPEGVICLLR